MFTRFIHYNHSSRYHPFFEYHFTLPFHSAATPVLLIHKGNGNNIHTNNNTSNFYTVSHSTHVCLIRPDSGAITIHGHQTNLYTPSQKLLLRSHLIQPPQSQRALAHRRMGKILVTSQHLLSQSLTLNSDRSYWCKIAGSSAERSLLNDTPQKALTRRFRDLICKDKYAYIITNRTQCI